MVSLDYGKAPSALRYGGPRSRQTLRAPRRTSAQTEARFVRGPLVAELKEPEGPYRVQGLKASDIEWRCYMALMALGWTDSEVIFQEDTMGGRMPGGQVLDFVVHAPGGDIVIAVDGDVWHNRTEAQRQDDLFQQQRISAALGYDVIYVKANAGDLLDLPTAYNFLERWVGHGGAP